MSMSEKDLQQQFLARLADLNYTVRPGLHQRPSLEANFRQKFEALNGVKITTDEFARLLAEIVTPDVYAAAHTLCQRQRPVTPVSCVRAFPASSVAAFQSSSKGKSSSNENGGRANFSDGIGNGMTSTTVRPPLMPSSESL